MKKILYLFLAISLIFAGCKKEDDAVTPTTTSSKIYGCTDVNAVNFNASANVYVPNICCYTPGCELGCTDESAVNYNFQATEDDGSCIYPATASWDCIQGVCYDPGTGNGQYNSESACNSACSVTASWDCYDGICYDPGTGNGQYNSESACNANCGSGVVYGCTDPTALNYGYDCNQQYVGAPDVDDGCCVTNGLVYGCMDVTALNYGYDCNGQMLSGYPDIEDCCVFK